MTNKEQEFELIKQVVLILCRHVRTNYGDLGYFGSEDSLKITKIYRKLVELENNKEAEDGGQV